MTASGSSEVSKYGEESMQDKTDYTATRARHGRYYAEYVPVASQAEHQRRIQEALDAGSRKSWHLVGVQGGVPDCAAILFWDTAPPSFGRTSRTR